MPKERKSNFELLRILAMFLVLVVHADYWSLGEPTAGELAASPAVSLLRIAVESMSIVCVNLFVLISGWFGIRFKWKSLGNFCFQVLFFGVSIYAFAILFLDAPITLKNVAACVQVIPAYWFVKAYLCLYILSPVLNSFCETVDRRSFSLVVGAFFVFETVYGWSGAARFVEQGYSTISFVGLYLLAQYVRRFVDFAKIRNVYVMGGVLRLHAWNRGARIFQRALGRESSGDELRKSVRDRKLALPGPDVCKA